MRGAALVLAAALHTPSVAARTDATLDPVVVSASALPLTEAAVSQHVSVFTREEIEREAPASVAEFLSRRAGLVVDRSSGSGAYGSLFMRGADPSHVVVLIDGVRQNDPLSSRGSAVDLATLTLDDIERIEVVRGNVSVVHAEAIAGVVQLFTRPPDGTSRVRLGVEAGGDDLRAAQASIVRGPWRASISERRDGERDTVGSSRTRAANLGYRESFGATRVHAELRAADSTHYAFPDDSGGLLHAVVRDKEKRQADTLQGSLALARAFTAGELSLSIARFERDSLQDTPPVAPGLRDPFGLPAIVAEGEYRRNEIDATWRWQAGAWELLAGAGWRSERGALDSVIFIPDAMPANFSMQRETDSVYTEGRRSAGRWHLHAGLRYEHTEGEDAFLHPALGVQFQANEASGRVGAALSSSSKLPSFYALAHPLVGNPDLEPERSRQVEVYYATPAASPWKSRVTLFRAHYRDLIDFDPGPPPRLVNRASIRSSGVELSASRRWHPRLLTYGQATRMNLDQPAGDPPLRFRPRLHGHVGAELRLDEKWRTHADLSYLGRRADSAIPTGEVWLGGRTLLSLSVARQAANWEAFVALDNALDKESEEAIGTPLPGRRVRVGLRWTP